MRKQAAPWGGSSLFSPDPTGSGPCRWESVGSEFRRARLQLPGWPAEDSRWQGTLVGGSDGFAPISVSPRAHGMSGVWGAHRLVPVLDGRLWGIAAACPFPAPPSQRGRAEGQHVQLGHSRKSLASLSHKPLSREGAASCLLVQPTPTGVGTNPDLCPRGSARWGPRL